MASVQELEAEIGTLRKQLDDLKREGSRNSQILKRSQQRELGLLASADLDTLFERMLAGLRSSYLLDAVTVVLCDPDHEVRHLLHAGAPAAGPRTDLLFVDALTGLAPQYVALHKPWLGAYRGSDHQLLFPGHDGLRSVALLPLRQDGKLFGSINFGSADAQRFDPHQANDFLSHLGVIASFALENAVNRARLQRSGFMDVLTGWYNRRYLQVRLKEELARARRQQAPLTCLMLDIDYFKRINDEFGHATGDAVLRGITQLIDSQIRATDVAARYGGEEFVILLPETELAAGRLLADRVRQAVDGESFEIDGGATIGVTVSIGVASIRLKREDNELKTAGDSLVARADVALYRAKGDGRNCIAVDEAA